MNQINNIHQSNRSDQATICSVNKINFRKFTTDSRVYNFLISGRALQVAASVSRDTVIVRSFVTSPIILGGIIPPTATGILETHIQITSSITTDPIAQSPPFATSRPVGLTNSGVNCWLNSSLQLLHERARI